MATYYVDFVNGADANNGLGPDASHASNKPWKTITKALGAAGAASGDTIYLSPAGPFRETVSVAMTSAVAETLVIGDYANQQGFKTSAAVRVTPGPVIVTAFTTNDKTAPSGTTLLNLAGRDFLTFRNIMFVGGLSSIIVTATTQTSTNITFTDCAFLTPQGAGGHMSATCAFNTPFNWLIDRCIFSPTAAASALLFTLVTGTSPAADYDCGVVIRNCVFIASGITQTIRAVNSGTAAQKGGGLDIQNCLSIGTQSSFLTTPATHISTTIPCTVNNCAIVGMGSASSLLSAGTSGQITENYNLLASTNTRTNVSTGANSISDGSYAPLYHFGQERIWGSLIRQFGEPMASSPLLAFGNDGNQTATDHRGVGHIRPAGGASALPAVGAMDRANTFIADTSPIGNGTSAIKVTGPGYAEFLVPVPASQVTISCVVKWDATYAGTKPQLQIDANGRNGVSAETVTAVGSSGSNETLTLSAFTPSRAGDMVTIRVISNDTNGGGLLQVDNFSVTG